MLPSTHSTYQLILLLQISISGGQDSGLPDLVPRELIHGVLSPNRPLHRQSILPDEVIYYSFDELRPSFTYEVKLSYPATMPSNFFMDLITTESREHVGISRKLLNTEKLVFTTPEDSTTFCRKTLLRIRAFSEAVPWDRTKPLGRILFNISVGGNFVGIPLECLPHAVWVASLLLLSPVIYRVVMSRITSANQLENDSKQKQ